MKRTLLYTLYIIAIFLSLQASAVVVINGDASNGGFTLPDQTGNSGKFLTTDGLSPSWQTVSGGSGTVTSVALTVPAFLSVAGSPITTSGTLAVSLSGTALPILNGGTGATTANAAFNNLAPSQTSNSGKFLTTDGTNTSWATVSASPGGSDAQVQYNNGGSFGGDADFVWDDISKRLGIKTASPSASLHVVPGTAQPGILMTAIDGYGAAFQQDATSQTGGRAYEMMSTTDGNGDVGGGKWTVRDVGVSPTSDGYRLIIDANGNVGFGANSPAYPIDIDPSTDTPALRIRGSGPGFGALFQLDADLNSSGGHNWHFAATGSSNGVTGGGSFAIIDKGTTGSPTDLYRLTVSPTGFVGIGDPTPPSPLTVEATDTLPGNGEIMHIDGGAFGGSFGTYWSMLDGSDQMIQQVLGGAGAIWMPGNTTTFRLRRDNPAVNVLTMNVDNTISFNQYSAGAAVFDSAGKFSSVAPGTSGNVLTSNGTTWVSSAPAFGTLANDTYLKGRNAANSADVNLIKVNTSDIVVVGSLSNNTNVIGSGVSFTGTNGFSLNATTGNMAANITNGTALILTNTDLNSAPILWLTDANADGGVFVRAPENNTLYTFRFPPDDGSSGQFLQTDGSGATAWAGVTANSIPNIGARAHNSATSISGTLATISWTTEDYDTNSALSSGVFTCPFAGKYQVNASLALSGTFILNNTTVMEIQKNGTAWSNNTHYIAAAITNEQIDISDVVNCAASDTIRIQVSNDGTTPAIVSSDTKNFLSISYLGQ